MRAALLALLLAVSAAHAQTAAAPDGVRVWVGGAASDLGAVVDAASRADVVFLGEIHNDSLGHLVEAEVLRALHARVGARRPVVLALEMVETDVQLVLDEYLAGLVSERDWLAASRPWTNYADYRPLVEYARAHGLPVVATNAPTRYVRLVARRPHALDSLSAEARRWLPPAVAPPSPALADTFTALMGGMSHGGGPSVEGMLAAQNLRDATMAWRIADALGAHRGALVVHVNGSFHSEGGLGIPEHLARLAPRARTLIVTMGPGVTPGASTGDDIVVSTPEAD